MTRTSLLLTHYSLLVTRYLLLVTYYSLLITRYVFCLPQFPGSCSLIPGLNKKSLLAMTYSPRPLPAKYHRC